jgi:alginate O-acetyltransferase complex protein AlgI
MEFSSLFFIFLFFPVFIFMFFILKKESHNSFLLIVSFIFYYLGEGKFLLILLLSIVVNYVLGICIQKSNSRKLSQFVFILGIIFNVGLLIFFKYTNFLVDNINVLFTNLGLNTLHISHVHLPIGISFFTFFSISYIIDVYRKTTSAEKNPLINNRSYYALS